MSDSKRNTVRGEQERNRDPTQIALPDINTSIGVSDNFDLDELVALVPSFGIVAIGLVLFAFGLPTIILGVSAVLAAIAAIIGTGMVVYAHENTTAGEIWTGWKRYFLIRRKMPVSNPISAELRNHNVKRIFRDGTAEMDDGTLVGMRQVSGRNTDNMEYGELDPMVAQLSDNIDQRIKDFDFSYYSTTRDHEIEETIGNYEDRAYSGALDRASGYMGEYARSLVEWFEEVDEPAEDRRDMRHYVVTRVEPSDVAPSTRSDSSAILRALIPFMGDDGGDGELGLQHRKAVQQEMYDRLETIEKKMFAGIEGVDVSSVSPEEHAEVLLAYWTGEKHDPDDTLERKFNRDGNGPDVWPPERLYKQSDSPETGDLEDEIGSEKAQHRLRTAVPNGNEDQLRGSDRELAGSHFDVKNGHIEIGDQIATTMWVTGFPAEIESGFLKPLYAMKDGSGGDLDIEGVDLDITIDATAVDKRQAKEEIKNEETNINAKSGEQARVESRETEEGSSVYDTAAEYLRNTNAQAWDISMFVTVRAGPRAALATAEDDFRDYEEFDIAKRAALENGKEAVKEVLESTPIEATVITPKRLQQELLDSCSPNKGNTFNDLLSDDGSPGPVEKYLESMLGDAGTSGPKQTRVLGGFLGAAFPPCAATINEDGGLNWGRDVESGKPFRTNPSDRSTGPHMITMGITRSGKTYGASSAAAAWYAEKDDRTLVVCDTQGGFAGLTEMLGGEHIVIEGSKTINPLDIQSPPEGNQDIDAFRMSVNSSTNFFKAILRSQGIDPSAYHSIIEQGIEQVYRDHGVVPGDVETDDMPTVRDLIGVWEDMGQNAEEYTLSGEGSEEADIKATTASELLDKLSGFSENGKYHNLLGETTLGLLDEDTNMAYLDLSQLNTDNEAEQSAMLALAQSQVNQKVRQTEGELMFVIDEAHQMLHSDEQVAWLQRGAREWARYDAIMWFISQHPSEFLADNSESSNADKKQALLDQCSFRQFFNMPEVKDEVLGEFVPHADHPLVDTIKNGLTPARDGRGFTECVVHVTDNDKPGWHRVQVEASPLEDHVLNYDPGEHGDFDQYMRQFLDGSALAPVERLSDDEAGENDVEADGDTPEGNARTENLAEMYADGGVETDN